MKIQLKKTFEEKKNLHIKIVRCEKDVYFYIEKANIPTSFAHMCCIYTSDNNALKRYIFVFIMVLKYFKRIHHKKCINMKKFACIDAF